MIEAPIGDLRGFLADEAQALGYTLDQVRTRTRPARARGPRGEEEAVSVVAKLIKKSSGSSRRNPGDGAGQDQGNAPTKQVYSILLEDERGFSKARARTFLRTLRHRQGELRKRLVADRQRGEAGRPAPVPEARPIDPAEAEKHFQALGRYRGPLAAPEVQSAARGYWASVGRPGAIWLARRLRTETNVEALHWSGAMLAEMGEVALAPILDELDRSPAEDQADALLDAIGWMIEATPDLRSPGAATEATLGRLLQSRLADIREGAAEAMRLLPPDRGAVWLESRLGVETNEDVIATIREVLGHLRAGA